MAALTVIVGIVFLILSVIIGNNQIGLCAFVISQVWFATSLIILELKTDKQ